VLDAGARGAGGRRAAARRLAAAATTDSAALAAAAYHGHGTTVSDTSTLVVYKSPTCGCCANWVEHMREHGFKVAVHDMEDVSPIKAKHGVTDQLASCHTATIGGYVVEGHVPAADVQRLLRERPSIAASRRRECRWARRAWRAPRGPLRRPRLRPERRHAGVRQPLTGHRARRPQRRRAATTSGWRG
jgi:hypothetical protein